MSAGEVTEWLALLEKAPIAFLPLVGIWFWLWINRNNGANAKADADRALDEMRSDISDIKAKVGTVLTILQERRR